MPIRSHPTTLRVEEELNKLKTWEASAGTPTAESICNRLAGLEELYKCTDDRLNLPVTQQVIGHSRNEKWVDELLDESVRFLDICGSTRDGMSQMREHLGDLQSCLRRKKVDLSITKFPSFQKKMKKDAKKFISILKNIDNEIGVSRMSNLDNHISALIRVLRAVSAITISIFEYLLVFLSVPVLKPNPTKWSLVSILMHKGTVMCDGQLNNANELEIVDTALYNMFKCENIELEKMQIAQNRVEALEARVEEIECGLVRVFRLLIKTRASLLNIVPN